MQIKLWITTAQQCAGCCTHFFSPQIFPTRLTDVLDNYRATLSLFYILPKAHILHTYCIWTLAAASTASAAANENTFKSMIFYLIFLSSECRIKRSPWFFQLMNAQTRRHTIATNISSDRWSAANVPFLCRVCEFDGDLILKTVFADRWFNAAIQLCSSHLVVRVVVAAAAASA